MRKCVKPLTLFFYYGIIKSVFIGTALRNAFREKKYVYEKSVF